MADRKISDLTALTTPATGDLIPIVDVSEAAAADKNKSITVQELFKGVPDGTAAAPGLAFESDDGNGIFLAGTDQVGVATGGVERVKFGAGEVVFNDGGNNYDFRIEGDTKGALFFVDASSDRIGVGITNPGFPFQVKSTTDAHVAIWDNGGIPQVVGVNDANGSTELRLAGQILSFTGAGGAGSEHARIDSSGRLLVGTSSSIGSTAGVNGGAIQIEGTDYEDSALQLFSNADSANTCPSIHLGRSRGTAIGDTNLVGTNDRLGGLFFVGADGTDRNTPAASVQAFVDGTPGTNDMPGRLVFSTTADGASSPTERMRISANGNITVDTNTFFVDAVNNRVGVGTTSPNAILELENQGDTKAIINARTDAANGSIATLELWSKNSGGTNNFGFIAYDGDDKMEIGTGGSGDGSIDIAFAGANGEAMRIDSSGRLLVGTSSDSGNTTLVLQGNSAYGGGTPTIAFKRNITPAVNNDIAIISFSNVSGGEGARLLVEADGAWTNGSSHPTRLVFSTTADGASSPTERMRITASGDVTTTGVSTFSRTNAGFTARKNDSVSITRTTGTPLEVNRQGSDGTIVAFYESNSAEGSITISGTTTSYNGAHLARWSQLPGGVERTEILRGSVLSNIDEMCEWGEEENEQLNRMQVSDVEGDKNVSGVFQAWDDDDDTYTNDFYCAMTGDFIIRIAQGVTVERGDLLMSAGDGTAKPQDDDIIRSKTIAKVTSTNVSCTYDDGSYCVPCVLMAC